MIHVRNLLSLAGFVALIALGALAIVGAWAEPTEPCFVDTLYEDGSYVCNNGTSGCREGWLCDD